MDAVSYSLASKQAQRIKKFINEPDSTSGIVTVPKTIASGETVTVPAGRVAVLPNVQIDGVLNVEGEVFIPSGATLSSVVEKVTSTDNAVVRFNGTTGDVQNSGVIIDDNGNMAVGSPTVRSKLTVFNASDNDLAYAGISLLRYSSTYGSNIFHNYNSSLDKETLNLSVCNNTDLLDPQYTKYRITHDGTHIWYGNTTSKETMRIDSAGRVTMPYQPSFYAYTISNNNVAAGSYIKFSDTRHNIGGAYDASTGRFTAPVKGVYHFNFSGVTHGVSSYFYVSFAVNGSPIPSSYVHLPGTEGEYSNLCTTCTLLLYANDFVNVVVGFNGGSPFFESGRSHFSGHLIG